MKEQLKEELLKLIERNSRIDLKELAVLVGAEEIDVVNAMEEMEKDGTICAYHTLINWEKTSIEKVTALIVSSFSSESLRIGWRPLK